MPSSVYQNGKATSRWLPDANSRGESYCEGGRRGKRKGARIDQNGDLRTVGTNVGERTEGRTEAEEGERGGSEKEREWSHLSPYVHSCPPVLALLGPTSVSIGVSATQQVIM